MSAWDAARLASRRQLPKARKMHGPVGGGDWHPDNASVVGRDPKRLTACSECGRHVCSCDPIGIGLKKLMCALFERHNYEVRPNRYLGMTEIVPVYDYRVLYVHPEVLRAFNKKLDDAGVKTVNEPAPGPSIITVPVGTVVSVDEGAVAVVRVGGTSTAEPAPLPTVVADNPEPGSELEKWCLLVAVR